MGRALAAIALTAVLALPRAAVAADTISGGVTHGTLGDMTRLSYLGSVPANEGATNTLLLGTRLSVFEYRYRDEVVVSNGSSAPYREDGRRYGLGLVLQLEHERGFHYGVALDWWRGEHEYSNPYDVPATGTVRGHFESLAFEFGWRLRLGHTRMFVDPALALALTTTADGDRARGEPSTRPFAQFGVALGLRY